MQILSYFAREGNSQPQGGGHWGVLETAKPKKKIVQNRQTAKKFPQNGKPHTPSKPIR